MELLPDADVVVFFDVDYGTWIKFLNIRNRTMDKNAQFRQSYSMVECSDEIEQHLKDKGIKVIRLRQKFSSPKKQAKALKALLRENDILL